MLKFKIKRLRKKLFETGWDYHHDRAVCLKAVQTLDNMKDSIAVDLLIEALNHRYLERDEDHRPDTINREIIQALVKKGDEALDPLFTAIKKDDCKVIDWIVVILEKIGDERAVDPLIDLFKKDPDDRVALALGRIGSDKAIKFLKDTLKNIQSSEAFFAVKGLRAVKYKPKNDEEAVLFWIKRENVNEIIRMGGKAIGPLCKFLPDQLAIEALGKFGKLAKDHLLEILTDSKADREVLACVTILLGNIGDPKVLDVIHQVYKKLPDWSDVKEAINKLEAKTPPSQKVFDRLNDKDVVIRFKAVTHLRENDPHAIQILKYALNDESDVVHHAAVSKLGEIGNRQAMKLLENVIINENLHRDVREDAREELIKLDSSYKEIIDIDFKKVVPSPISIEDNEALNPLISQLSQEDNFHDVINALDNLNSDWKESDAAKKKVKYYISKLKDPNTIGHAIKVLGYIGDSHAIQPLKNIIDEKTKKIADLDRDLKRISASDYRASYKIIDEKAVHGTIKQAVEESIKFIQTRGH